MVDDALIFKSRPRKYGLASELGNVRVACRLMDGHPSTFYRWREQVLRSAEVTEMCLGRRPRPCCGTPNRAPPRAEDRQVATAC